MTNWKKETAKYFKQLSVILGSLPKSPPQTDVVPHPSIDFIPSRIQYIVYRAKTFYQIGIWTRNREVLESIICLWEKGYISSAISLSRTNFELWAACNYQTNALDNYIINHDIEKLENITNRLFEGVKDQVLMPWGTFACQKPINIMNMIRKLKEVFSESESIYSQLCEIAHANQPRYLELYLLGRLGDNWTNNTVKNRGHAILEKSVFAIETSVLGISLSADKGLKICDELFTS